MNASAEWAAAFAIAVVAVCGLFAWRAWLKHAPVCDARPWEYDDPDGWKGERCVLREGHPGSHDYRLPARSGSPTPPGGS